MLREPHNNALGGHLKSPNGEVASDTVASSGSIGKHEGIEGSCVEGLGASNDEPGTCT